MVLQHIEYFRAVAETGNMTKAAAMLHVSQPSLSIAIAKIEEELGVKLFDRMGNRIYLNPLGNRFLQKTNDIMRQLNEVKDEIAELAGMHSRSITVLSDYDHLFEPIIAEFAQENPELQITQFLCLPEKVVELLENGTADFAITTHDLSSEQLSWEPIAQRNRAVLMSKDDALASRTSLEPSDLYEKPLIMYNSSFRTERLIQQFRQDFGFSPNIRFITNEFETMVDLVQHNLGISIVTEPEAERLCGNPRMSMCYRVLHAEHVVQKIGIAYHKGHFMSETAKKMKAFVAAQLTGH